MFVLYLVYMPNNDVPEFVRSNQNMLMMFCMLIAGHFLATDWLIHFIVRQILYWIFALLQMSIRRKYEENELGFSIIIGIAYIILVEASIYNNYRQKALLFVQVKLAKDQETQLSNLLDSVPDKVLICT